MDVQDCAVKKSTKYCKTCGKMMRGEACSHHAVCTWNGKGGEISARASCDLGCFICLKLGFYSVFGGGARCSSKHSGEPGTGHGAGRKKEPWYGPLLHPLLSSNWYNNLKGLRYIGEGWRDFWRSLGGIMSGQECNLEPWINPYL